MALLRKLLTYSRVLRRGNRNQGDLLGYLWRRPALFLAVQGYEAAVLVSSSVPTQLKALAQTRAAGRIGCPF
jgi:hypothetical protein